MSDTLSRREVAHAAREHAKAAGQTEGFGTRGRVSKGVVLGYLADQPAKTVREIAGGLGVEVTPNGKISESEYDAVASFVTQNTPKEGGE